MKRYLRFCLILLISFALPLSGMAGVQAPTEPCPMKTMGMAMMDKDCCQDMSTPSEHGKPCKPGQECKTGGMLQVTLAKPPVTLFSPIIGTFFIDALPAHTPSGVWRPPRA